MKNISPYSGMLRGATGMIQVYVYFAITWIILSALFIHYLPKNVWQFLSILLFLVFYIHGAEKYGNFKEWTGKKR